jgi:hypothetical protein
MPATRTLAAVQAVQLAGLCALMRALPDDQAQKCLQAFHQQLASLLDDNTRLDDATDEAMTVQVVLIEQALRRE